MSLWNELYGCNNYIKIPFDTLMDMPVYIRKFWIQKYNADGSEIDDINTNGNSNVINGMAINTYASLEQEKLKS